jgi:hypothetical protein
LVIPNDGVADAAASFALDELVLEAAQKDDRIRAGSGPAPGRRTREGPPQRPRWPASRA